MQKLSKLVKKPMFWVGLTALAGLATGLNLAVENYLMSLIMVGFVVLDMYQVHVCIKKRESNNV